MPKLNIDWETNGQKPFLEMGVNATFQSNLPSEETFKLAEIDELFGVPMEVYTGLSMDNWSELAVRSLYNVASSFGIQQPIVSQVGNFAVDMVNLWRQPPGVTGKQVIEGTVFQAIDISLGALSAYPVVGWIAQIAYSIGRQIYDVIQLVRDAEKEVPVQAVAYNASADTDLSKRMLDETKGRDWTRAFLPAVRPSSFESQLITFGTDDEGVSLEGFAVRPDNFSDIDGLGVLAGLPKIFSNIQMPRPYTEGKVPLPGDSPVGWPDDVPFCVVNFYAGGKQRTQDLCKNTGDFLPSTEQLGYTLWGMVRKNSANAFKVDQNRIIEEWSTYFGELIEYVKFKRAQGGDRNYQRAWVTEQSSSVGAYNPVTGQFAPWANPGVADIPGFQEYLQNGGAEKVGAAYKNPAFYEHVEEEWWLITYGSLVQYMVRNQISALRQNFLDTITIAYVDETFPALGQNAAPAIKEKFSENRKKLLVSSAVSQVELDMIPDASYRNAVAQAQMQATFDITAAPDAGIIGDIIPVPIPPVHPIPPPMPGQLVGEPQPSWLERYGPLLAGGAAVALGGYLAYRHFSRRPNGLYLPPASS